VEHGTRRKKCWKSRGNLTLDYWNHFNNVFFLLPGNLALGRWIIRGGIYPYRILWILTLKGIHAEGLQQKEMKRSEAEKNTMREE
jgi:hypothetical protein